MTNKFKGKKIAVVGIGIEGLSSARFLAKKGAVVSVLDQKKEKELDQRFLKILREKDIKIFGGEDYLKNLSKYDLVVRSPGVNIKRLQTTDHGLQKITSQIKIFFDLCPCKIIGVTGTKGKGTTSSLIYEMLKRQGVDAYLGGNIGKPPLDFLDKLNPQSIAVLELSSFQLQDITKSPHIAVFLMTTSEHLDYHKDTHEYVDAKRNILRFQAASDIAIVNKDYPASNESDIHTEGKVYKISREHMAQDGCYVEDGKIMVRVTRGPVKGLPPASAPSSFSSSDEVRAVGSPSTFATPRSRIAKIIETREILLPGEHNLENVCAAVMASLLSGVSKENIVSVLKSFKGLKHRLELVKEVKGVRFYDDSFSTIPETTIAAISAFKEPEILILGGSSKGSDFKELGRVIFDSKNIKAIIGIGIEWDRIKKEIRFKNKDLRIIESCKNMQEVIQEAFKLAKSGDVVLLSPACASFGMFKNYKDRGEQFKSEVRRLRMVNSVLQW